MNKAVAVSKGYAWSELATWRAHRDLLLLTVIDDTNNVWEAV